MSDADTADQSAQTPKVSLRAFWGQLSPAGRWLLSTTAIQTLGRGMVLPFTIVYFTEVRHVSLDTAGVLMGLIAVAALVVTGPSGALTDRVGSRRILIGATLCAIIAPLVLGFGTTIPVFVVGICIMGIGWGATWAAWNTLIATVVSGPARMQFFGINFALVNLGIGLGGVVSGLFVDVDRPSTFTTIFVLDALCMVIPLVLFFGPLRSEGGPVPVPASLTAVVGVIAFMAIFGFGETMMQSTIPALVNDLADDHTRGRANGLNSGAFQLGAITGPVMAGLVLHRGHWVAFIAILIVGCGVVALSAVGIKSIVPRRVNGIPDPAQDEVEIPHVPVHD